MTQENTEENDPRDMIMIGVGAVQRTNPEEEQLPATETRVIDISCQISITETTQETSYEMLGNLVETLSI